MKGNETIIATLNVLLKSELQAIMQYVTHHGIVSNWDYTKLADYTMGRARDEMKHADQLIDRIIFLGAIPAITDVEDPKIGKDVPQQLGNDWTAESTAIQMYNDAIVEATELKDAGTVELLEDILEDEERHINDIESRQDQLGQMGLQNFLSLQV